MGNFTAKAFVKITDAKRKEEVFFDLAFKPEVESPGMFNSLAELIYFDKGFIFDCEERHKDSVGDDFIDCNHYANGDEDLAVKLFLELAEMRDNTDLHHWFVSEEMFYQGSEVFGIGTYFSLGEDKFDGTIKAHRLTPLELAEAVMHGDIKL